jgi:hypothetical protein
MFNELGQPADGGGDQGETRSHSLKSRNAEALLE